MKSFSVKGVCFAEGRPKTIVSLMGATQDELIQTAQRAVAAGADCLEWRADFARDLHDSSAMATCAQTLAAALPHTPLIFTFRSRRQGGEVELPAAEYAQLLHAVVETKSADLVDVEACVGDDVAHDLVRYAHAHGTLAIVSHHDFDGTPATSWMANKLEQMAALGADIPKLAVMAHEPTDCLRLMEATAQAQSATGLPLITMAMGKDGVLSRLAGESVGSVATFCALGTPSAPGQVELTQAIKVLDLLHQVRT